jgi:hypothetical protein
MLDELKRRARPFYPEKPLPPQAKPLSGCFNGFSTIIAALEAKETK